MGMAGHTFGSANKRRSARLPCRIQVDVHTKDGARALMSHDISRHGLYLISADPMQERHVVRLTIHIPSGPFEATAWVTRSVPQPVHGPAGAGVQLFSLNAEAKERWDAFFRALESGLMNPQAPSQQPAPAAQNNVARRGQVDVGSFVLKFGSKEKLREFERHSIAAGGTFLVTPVLKPIGTRTQLIMVHPDTDEEFIIIGTVIRVHLQSPKGVEIHFHAVDDTLRSSFHRFIESGTNQSVSMNDAWTRVTTGMFPQKEVLEEIERYQQAERERQARLASSAGASAPATPTDDSAHFQLAAPKGAPERGARIEEAFKDVPPPADQAPSSSAPQLNDDSDDSLEVVLGIPEVGEAETFDWDDVSSELTIDLEIADHVTTDIEITESDFDDLIIEVEDAVDDDSDHSEHVKELMGVLSRTHLRVYCSACEDADFMIKLGDADGLLGLVARQRPYWCKRCGQLHTVPRVWPPGERKKRFAALDAATLSAASVSAATLFELADLSGPPRCPSCTARVTTITATKAIERAAQKINKEHTIIDTDAACPRCQEGTWTVLKVIHS